MDFPTTEPEIKAFCDRMLDGYMWHGADFPKVNRVPLTSKRLSYIMARKALVEARSKLRFAVKATDERLQELKTVMKNCLQKSEVDVAGNPEKLRQIGWGPRTEPQPAQLPGQPMNLRIVAKDDRTVTLQWEKPLDGQRVRNYVIERRQENGDGVGDWTIFCISYQTQAKLTGQPLGVHLEYRIKAANNAGTGPASNTVSVVL